MGSVIYDKSMSLDGYIAGANMRVEAGLGDDGERLHDWAFKDPAGMELIQREVGNLGAVICGRRTYDMSIKYWGTDGPTSEARVPVFVLSHTAPDDVPEGGVYTFVGDLDTHGLAPQALEQCFALVVGQPDHRVRLHRRDVQDARAGDVGRGVCLHRAESAPVPARSAGPAPRLPRSRCPPSASWSSPPRSRWPERCWGSSRAG